MGERSANGGLFSLFELVRRLKNSECQLYTQLDGASWTAWREHGIQVNVVGSQNRSRTLGGNWRQAARFAKDLRATWQKSPPDVVVCNDIRAVFSAALVARSLGIPTVFFVRDIFAPQREYGIKWRIAISFVDLLLCLSEEMATELRTRLIPIGRAPLRLEILYSVVDFERMQADDFKEGLDQRRQQLRRKYLVPSNQFAILYAAGICDKKNQLELIANLDSLRSAMPNAHIYFVGDFSPLHDAYSSACQQMTHKKGLDEFVTFVGYTNSIEDWYVLADCTLLASRREGLARCMIESLACGVPVVSFDVTSAREILEKHACGLVSKQGDYLDLFRKLLQLYDDPGFRTACGQRGAEVARQLFSPNNATGRFMALLERLSRDVSKNETASLQRNKNQQSDLPSTAQSTFRIVSESKSINERR